MLLKLVAQSRMGTNAARPPARRSDSGCRLSDPIRDASPGDDELSVDDVFPSVLYYMSVFPQTIDLPLSVAGEWVTVA
jgi:hypothetical protein